jgi:outer membrane protein assembly factor BamB
VVLASGHLIVLTEDGELALVRATPERHEEIVRFPALDGKTWNHPALTDGVLLIRNLAEMAAYDLR